MASTERRESLGDYFTLQRGTTYRSKLLGQPGPALLGLASIQRHGGFRADSIETYGGEAPDKLLVQPGGLYASLKDVTQSADLLGAVARLPLGYPPGRLTQDTVKLVPKSNDVPLDYLYWLLRTPQYRAYCRAHATGTTNLGLAREDFLAFPAAEPTPIQCVIVETLGTLDNKIEKNGRIGETLEAIAQALFKAWFVDFDPTRARADGRDPGLPKPLADLFSDSFDDSALGPVPRGWDVCTWGSLVTLEYGKALSGYDANDGTYPVYGTNGRIGTHSQPLCPHAGVIIGRKGAYRGVHYSESPFFAIDTAFYLEPKVPMELRWAYYELLRQDINAMDSGSAIPSTSRTDFYRLPVVAPPVDIQRSFTKLLEPMWRQQAQNQSLSKTLATLRDTLLPKLFSGELRVTGAKCG